MRINARLVTTFLVPLLALWVGACTAPPIAADIDDSPRSSRGSRREAAKESDSDDDETQPTGDDGVASAPAASPTKQNAGTPTADECVAPLGVKLQDQDLTDSQLPWKRTGGGKVVIFFETKNVTPVYLDDMKAAVENWNKSPCLDTRLVASCPSGANCVTVQAPNPATDGDGNFDAVERGGFTTGGHIDMLPGLSEGERLNVMIHEMGHAIGLRHRKTTRVLMNADTFDNVFASDPVDYQNLLVLYGNQK